MNGILLLCVSLTFSTGSTIEAAVGAVPFSICEVVEKTSHSAEPVGDRGFLIEDRNYQAIFAEDKVVIRSKTTEDERTLGHVAVYGKAGDYYEPLANNFRWGYASPPIASGNEVRYDLGGFKESYEARSSGIVRRISIDQEAICKYERFLVEFTEGGKGQLVSNADGMMTPIEVDASHSVLLEEFIIDTCITYLGAVGWQLSPCVAFDGTNYLVVWEDFRNGISDIYGARVDTSGAVLDPAGIEIFAAHDEQVSPSVVFGGTDYLVVWEDHRRPPYSDIHGTRVATSGTVLDPSGIDICMATYWQKSPFVAFDGTNYLVVWEDGRVGPYDIYGTRVNQSGVVLDSSGIAISTGWYYQYSPCVAFDGTNYLVVWQDGRSITEYDIYGTRLDKLGIVVDSLDIPISTAPSPQEFPAVAFDGINYLVAWDDQRNGNYDIYGARVDQDGVVLDSSGIGVATGFSRWERAPWVAFDGTNYLVVWSDAYSGTTSIYGTRVDPSGTVLDTSGIFISVFDSWVWGPCVASNGADYLIVWSHRDSWSEDDIFGARVNQSGAVLDPSGIAISTAANMQEHPSVAFDGNNYFVVWQDRRSDLIDIYGARVDQLGTVLDPAGVFISPDANRDGPPRVAFDGTNYLVVWGDNRNYPYDDIYGARVSQSGTVLDSSGIAICTARYVKLHPSVAFGDSTYFVAWQDRPTVGDDDIYGARVTKLGTVLDSSGIPICLAGGSQEHPSLAFDGDNYLVVWQDARNFYGDIYGTRVSQSGTVLDPIAIPICTALDHQWFPSVLFHGTKYLVVWEDRRAGAYFDVYGALVNQSGVVEDTLGIAICTEPDNQRHSSLGFDGANYFVVWGDERSGTDSDIYGARVDTSGIVLDPSGIRLVDQPDERTNPAVTVGPSGQQLLVYEGFTLQPYGSNRVFGAFYTGVGVQEEGSTLNVVHSAVALCQNRPNPFHLNTTIEYQIPARSHVSLRVYDVTGSLIETLVNERQIARAYRVHWNGKDKPSGVYFYRLQAGDFTDVKKMILLR